MHSKVPLWTFLAHIHKNNMNSEIQLLAPEKCIGAVDDRFLLVGTWLNYTLLKSMRNLIDSDLWIGKHHFSNHHVTMLISDIC